jgi:hypothetical protein
MARADQRLSLGSQMGHSLKKVDGNEILGRSKRRK